MQQLIHTTKPATNSSAREVLDIIPPVMWFIRREMRAHRRGLSVPQLRALVKINSKPAVSLSEVAEHVEASLPTASRMIDALVKKGLLSRKGCSNDRRVVELALTTQGRAMLVSAWSATQAKIAEELANLTPAQHASINEAMEVFKNIFGSMGLSTANASLEADLEACPKLPRTAAANAPKKYSSRVVPHAKSGA
jgi:DNA-binding MarR family transcriptional regulator